MSQHVDVVVLALHLLGGHSRSVDTEDVAMKAHELAPGRFAWKKYDDQVNLELVRVSLSDGKKPAARGLVVGSGREGWRLSPDGVRWASENAEKLGTEDHSRQRSDGQGGGIDERRWRAERGRILSSRAWEAFSSSVPITPQEALDLFRIDVYTVGKLRSAKVARLVAQFTTDDEIRAFLEAAEAVLPSG